MSTKYGQIDIAAKVAANKRKPRQRSVIPQEITPQVLEERLAQLSFQNRAPSVAKSATETLLEPKVPKKAAQELALISASDVTRLIDIYDRICSDSNACPHCGKGGIDGNHRASS